MDVVLNIKDALRELDQDTTCVDIEGVVNEILDEQIIFNWVAEKKQSKKAAKKKIKSKKQFKFPSCVSN